MKVDFTQELKDFAGEPLKLPPPDPSVKPQDMPNLTLKDVISIAIKTALQEDANLALDAKIKLDKIGEVVWKGVGDFDTDMASLIKERISKVFTSPAVSGAVRRAIEG